MSLPEPAIIETLVAEAAKHGFEESCAPETGALLRMLAAAKPKGRFMNLGTGFGVSSAWLLDGMSDDAELWTVDIDETGSAVAKAHLDQRLRVVVEDGSAFLEGANALGSASISSSQMPCPASTNISIERWISWRAAASTWSTTSHPPRTGRRGQHSPLNWSTKSRPIHALSASASIGRPAT